ncbi:MAG: 5-keto-L-gluconate epimerase [Armatimonadota bacterium]|nr:5-keto-L-gluconate epimerase [Armatimonadota bacterium]
MKLSLVVSLEETAFDAVAVRGTWRDGLRMAAELGYDGVELAVRDPGAVDAGAVAGALRDLGLPLVAVGTGQAYLAEGLSLSDAADGVRRRAVERMEAHIRFAARFGAAVIVGLLRGRAGGEPAAAGRRLEQSLAAILPAAEREKVPVLIEPINRYETDLLTTIGDAVALSERLGSASLGVVADTFHMNIEEAAPEAALRAAGPRLRHVHAADSNRLAPGWGHLDFSSIVSTLREIGYRGFLSAEILPRPDPRAAAQQFLAHLRPLLGEAVHPKGGYV